MVVNWIELSQLERKILNDISSSTDQINLLLKQIIHENYGINTKEPNSPKIPSKFELDSVDTDKKPSINITLKQSTHSVGINREKCLERLNCTGNLIYGVLSIWRVIWVTAWTTEFIYVLLFAEGVLSVNMVEY